MRKKMSGGPYLTYKECIKIRIEFYYLSMCSGEVVFEKVFVIINFSIML